MFISIIFSAASCKTSKTCLCTLLRDFLPLSGLHKGKRRGKDNVISIAPILVKPLRRSGMDHTVLSANNIMPACTDGATTDCDRRLTNCSLLPICRLQTDERLSWLTYSGRFTTWQRPTLADNAFCKICSLTIGKQCNGLGGVCALGVLLL